MAPKTPHFDFRTHISAGAADVLGFGAAFVVVAGAAVLACWLIHWS